MKRKLLNKLGTSILSLVFSAGAFVSAISPAYASLCPQTLEESSSCDLALSELENQSISLLAKNCGLKEQKLRGILHFKASGRSCALVPLCDCNEHKQCFLRLFSYANPDYMKYYLSGQLKSPEYVNGWFSRSVRSTVRELPRSITFMIKTEDKVVGRVGIGPLQNRGGVNAEIGYAIEECYSGKGITKKAVMATLSFLAYLRNSNNKCYRFKKLRATAKVDNKASNHILSSCGFILSKNLIDDGFGPENEYFYHF